MADYLFEPICIPVSGGTNGAYLLAKHDIEGVICTISKLKERRCRMVEQKLVMRSLIERLLLSVIIMFDFDTLKEHRYSNIKKGGYCRFNSIMY